MKSLSQSFLFSILFSVSFTILLVQPAYATSQACEAWMQNVTDTLKSDQVVVARANGNVLFDWSDGVYKRNTPHSLWSVSKTVTATLAASAIQQEKIAITDPLTKYLPSSLRTRRSGRTNIEKIVLSDLLSMTSGFAWNEHPDDEAQKTSDLPMLYSLGYHNLPKYLMQTEFAATPGHTWNYSSANGTLMMAVLRKAYGTEYDDMPWKNLFNPLGIKSAHIEQDGTGNYMGATNVFLSAQDMAKIGELYLNDGVAKDGTRILPEGWVDYSKQLVEASLKGIHSRADYKHGGPYSRGSFWLNSSVRGIGKPYPNSPASMIVAEGLMGQWIIILPDQNLVIARTGHDGFTDSGLDGTVAGAIACFGK
jgi:CubicO group peptidase (beta-lactamase class C family)